MEEKERFELFGEHCIKDNNPDARCQLLDAYVACVILNEQDKRIKQLREDLCQKDKQIADLQHKLEVAETALNKMSVYAIGNRDLYNLVNDFYAENERYDIDPFCINTCVLAVDYFKEQAEKEIKGE